MNRKKTIIFGSFLLGIAMNSVLLILALFIRLETHLPERPVDGTTVELVSFALVYEWPVTVWQDLVGMSYYQSTGFDSTIIFMGNLIFYSVVSFALLLFFSSRQTGQTYYYVPVFCGLLSNPILLAILIRTDAHVTQPVVLSLAQLDSEVIGVLFKWPIYVLPYQVPFRDELVFAMLFNTLFYAVATHFTLRLILYFAKSKEVSVSV